MLAILEIKIKPLSFIKIKATSPSKAFHSSIDYEPWAQVDTTDPEFNSSSLPDSMVELIIQDGKTEGRDDRMPNIHES